MWPPRGVPLGVSPRGILRGGITQVGPRVLSPKSCLPGVSSSCLPGGSPNGGLRWLIPDGVSPVGLSPEVDLLRGNTLRKHPLRRHPFLIPLVSPPLEDTFEGHPIDASCWTTCVTHIVGPPFETSLVYPLEDPHWWAPLWRPSLGYPPWCNPQWGTFLWYPRRGSALGSPLFYTPWGTTLGAPRCSNPVRGLPSWTPLGETPRRHTQGTTPGEPPR
jgi:hypothetical protein